jgi:hypothetical protein
MSAGFAILFRCKEVYPVGRKPHDTPLTARGTLAWLTEDEGYWWGDTFSEYGRATSRTNIPRNVVMFETREKAEAAKPEIMEHIGPWFVKPDGWFEIVEIRQKFKQVTDGYEAVK